MIELVRDWLVLTALRIVHALGCPTWLLVLLGIVVVPVVAVYTYFWYVARVLRASE